MTIDLKNMVNSTVLWPLEYKGAVSRRHLGMLRQDFIMASTGAIVPYLTNGNASWTSALGVAAFGLIASRAITALGPVFAGGGE